MGVLLLCTHNCKAIVENSMAFVRSTVPKLELPTPNLNPCNSASKETGIGFTKPKLFPLPLSEKKKILIFRINLQPFV